MTSNQIHRVYNASATRGFLLKTLFVLFLLVLFIKLKFNLRLLAAGQANLRRVTLNLFEKEKMKHVSSITTTVVNFR